MRFRELVEYARQMVFSKPELNDTIMNSLDIAQHRIVAGANEHHECERAKEEMWKITNS